MSQQTTQTDPATQVPPHPKRAAMLRRVGLLDWPLYPVTILKAHVYFLTPTCEVAASGGKIARWAKTTQPTVSRYRHAMADIGLLTIQPEINGKRQAVFLKPSRIKTLTKSDGRKLVELAKSKTQNQYTGNTQKNHGTISLRKTEKGKKPTGFSAIGNVVQLHGTVNPKTNPLFDANDSKDAEKWAAFEALHTDTDGDACD